jgi:integrase
MGRTKSTENALDPATGKPLSPGVGYRGPHQYRARKLVDGKSVAKTFESDKLAKEWREETEAKVRVGSFVDRRSLDKSTVAEFVQKFEDEMMQDGGERRGAAEDRGHTPSLKRDDIGKLKLSELTSEAVQGFRKRQLAKHAKGTVVKRLNLLAAMINHAIAEWHMPFASNPATAKAVTRPKGADKKRNRRLQPASDDAIQDALDAGEEPPLGEEQRMYAALAESPWPHDTIITRWAIAQATRQGEAFALRWGDINLRRKLVQIHGRHRLGTKNDDAAEEIGPEVRPLMPEAIAILLELKGDRRPGADDLVFNIGPQSAFKTRFGRMMTKAGLLDFTYHDLRHEATSRLAKRYKHKEDLMRVTGHRDLKSLNRYYTNPPKH